MSSPPPARPPPPPLVVFGANDSGQLGTGTAEDAMTAASPLPASVSAGVRLSSVSMGLSHAVWLSSEGQVYTVGLNDCGQCGVSTPETLLAPIRLDALSTKAMTQVSAGASHTLATSSECELFAWGANDFGQCGLGDELLEVRRPRPVRGMESVSVAAAGDQHSLIIDLQAQLLSCGQGRFGALGLGDTDNRSSPTLVLALTAMPVRVAAAGERHSACLTFSGAIWAWGWRGEVGLSLPGASKIAPTPRLVPMPAPSRGQPAAQIAVGGGHFVARLADGSVIGWGRGASGELGTGAAASSATARRVLLPAETTAVDVAAGREHSLGLLSDGRVMAWGGACCGQLGLGDTVDVSTPVEVPLPSGCEGQVRAVVAGGHSSALLLDPSAGSVVPKEVSTLALAEVRDMCERHEFGRLAQLVGAVFGSPALFNASFAAEGKLQSQELEAVYVQLLQTYEAAPAVFNALRSSMSRLLDLLAKVVAAADFAAPAAAASAEVVTPAAVAAAASTASSASTAPAEAASTSESQSPAAAPPLLPLPAPHSPARSQSGSSSTPLPTPPSPARSVSGSFSSTRSANEPFVLKPLVGVLCNPLMSHASETGQLIRAATIVDTMPAAHRARLTELLRELPADLLVARCVRPIRDALERELRVLLAGGSRDATGSVRLIRLLGAARDANEEARRAGGGVSPREFYSEFLSDRLDMNALQHDYFVWAQHGPSERGTDPRGVFSFCSEPWLFTPAAKARLLQVEAAHRMGRSQQQAVHAMFGMRFSDGGGAMDQQVLFPPKRRRSIDSNRPSLDPSKAAASPFFVLTVRREHLVEDTLDVLATSVVGNLLKPLRVIFEGEPAIDEGGVRKEFFQLLVEALFDQDFGMFSWNEEARAFWFASASLEAEAEYFLIGLAIGLAIHNSVILDLRLPPLLYRRLMNEPVGLPDLKEVQPDLYRGLLALLEFDGDVQATFMADFSVVTNTFGEEVVHELLPDGANTPVTNTNRHEYVRLYVEYLLVSGVRVQFDAFQRGFLKLCDGPAFSFLTPLELEELVCGTPLLDFKALQEATKYDGFEPDDELVKWFWEVVHSFGIDDKKALLFFATGSDRAPVGGLGRLKFILQRGSDDPMNLPHAHTCFNVLSLPAYTSRSRLRDRLTTAIHNSHGFGLQ